MRCRIKCEHARAQHMVWALTRILICLLVSSAILALFVGCARINIGSQSTSRPTATAIPRPTAVPTVRPTATAIPEPPTTPTVTIPRLAQAYDGTFHNTTVDLSGTFILTNIVQNGGDLRGLVTVPAGFCGTGPFIGTIGRDGRISLVDTPPDGACVTYFEGSLRPDGTLAGTVRVPDRDQVGTWQAKPA